MQPPQYAVVAYVRNPLGRWVEELRREIHPETAHLPAHLTVLPPRTVRASESQAVTILEELCSGVRPFEIELGDVETFIPTTLTVFLRVAHAAYKMRELHDRLDTGALYTEEPWPYMPHLTIVKMTEIEPAQRAAALAIERWSHYRGPRRVRVDELTFVREGADMHWDDVVPIQLGRELASKTR